MNQEKAPLSNAVSQPMNDNMILKTWSKPDLVELDFVSGTNSNIAKANANDGIQDCQS